MPSFVIRLVKYLRKPFPPNWEAVHWLKGKNKDWQDYRSHKMATVQAIRQANILNNQFKSVFTPREPPGSTIPKLEGPRFPSIDSLPIRVEGVQKLLSNLNVTKASGPDNISCKILYELSTELAPMLCKIFQQSIHIGQISHDWTTAFVTPIFKKGNRHLAGNYRPVSLTSVPCKIL